VVYCPDHPRAWSTGYVHVHVLVAEWKLGRLLLPGETVHHDDENRLNNSPENIIVAGSNSEHARIHAELRSERESVVLQCGYCGKEIKRSKSRAPDSKGYERAFCDHRCAGKANGFQKTGLVKHGTPSAYAYHRCRCRVCRDAHARRQRDYQRRRAGDE
jgi:hypothetical protein